MDFLTLNGSTKNVPIAKYKINWDGTSLSKFQRGVKDFLRPYWNHKRIYEEFPVAGTRMHIDYVNLDDRIAIEVSGAQHYAYNSHMHQGSLANYRAQIKRDLKKEKWCEVNGFVLVEIMPEDLPLTPEFFLDRYKVHL